MAQIGYDPSALGAATHADRHGPVSDRYHHISADPILAAKAGGGRGATIVPRATAAGGSIARRSSREIKVHLTQDGATSEVVTIQLDKLDKARLTQIMSLASSPQDVWRRVAEDQLQQQKQAALAVEPTPVMTHVPAALPPQAQAVPMWPWDNAAPPAPLHQQFPQAAVPATSPVHQPSQAELKTQMQLSFLAEQLAATMRLVQQQAQQPAPQAAPVVENKVDRPEQANPLESVGLGYLGYPGPKEPEHQVIFNWGPLGLQAGYYHAVKITNDVVTLEFDTRSRTQQYMPVRSDTPVSIVVINQREHTQKPMTVLVSGLQFRVGCLDICVLIVEDTPKESPALPAIGGPVHKAVTLNDLIEGVVPDELPEVAHGKVRGYQ